ncbi:MAG: TldD/PmbA family protein [Bryobacteraceae bacterium]
MLLVLPLRAAEPIIDVLSSELQRNFKVLKEKGDPAPYFLAFEVTEQDSAVVSASLGALAANSQSRSRNLDVSIRVGSPQLDNYHRTGRDRLQFTFGSAMSLDDDPAAIKRQVWFDTDRAYRLAAERLIRIRTDSQVKVAREDSSDEFSKEEPRADLAAAAGPVRDFSRDAWAGRLRKLSARFASYPGILVSNVTVHALEESKYFVSSEGARLRHGRGFYRITITASARADDGMDLVTAESFEASDAAGLPSDDRIATAVDKVAKELTGLLRAPMVDPYVGPAILSGRAAGVFFHEIFGHRVEGHRQKDETEGQTFTKSVGQPVLPDFLSVIFDPTRKKAAGSDLNGAYRYDDEGIAARPVTVVDKGILKTFLMSRSPIRGFDQSNGHGRRQVGAEVVSRQSNLIVESTRQVPDARLRQMLVEEVKKQHKPYGLFFQDITGGFTNTGRGGIQAFKVIPLVVYRVYADGRPDELVRGADIVGTPLSSFSKILATSDRPDAFNGYCGAESGSVPVAAVSPALLVSEIEIEKKAKSQERPPLLPAPSSGEAQ